MENLTPPEEQIYVPPAAPPPEPERIHEVVKYVPPVVVDTVMPAEMTPLTTEEVLASSDGEVEEANGSGFGEGLIPGQGSGDTEEAFFQVEVMPSFRGGDLTKFREWVGKRTNYPQEAIDRKIRGTVFLTFIVEKDGSVSNVNIVKGVHPLLDSEAIKVISESPKWSPGLQRGQPVRVRFQIPLNFIY
jgi:protein TonB